jgi:hypothetical protein
VTCKREFPHLVEMHKKYAAQGLVAISVSLDDPRDKKVRGKIDQFLEKQRADFPNLVLDAKDEEWQERLKINGPPCVYVFNRDNRHVLKLVEEEVKYAEIDKEVRALLAQK